MSAQPDNDEPNGNSESDSRTRLRVLETIVQTIQEQQDSQLRALRDDLRETQETVRQLSEQRGVSPGAAVVGGLSVTDLEQLAALPTRMDDGFNAIGLQVETTNRRMDEGFEATDRRIDDGFAASDRRIGDSANVIDARTDARFWKNETIIVGVVAAFGFVVVLVDLLTG